TRDTTDNGIIEIVEVASRWRGYTYYEGVSAPANGDFVDDPKFTGLIAVNYQSCQRDDNSCETMVEDDIVLDIPDPINADLQINVENCSNFEGEIEVINPVGGQDSNYSYQLEVWDGADYVNMRSIQTTRVFSGLGAGQ